MATGEEQSFLATARQNAADPVLGILDTPGVNLSDASRSRIRKWQESFPINFLEEIVKMSTSNTAAVSATPFVLSDWSHQLNLLEGAPLSELKAHLDKVPPEEANSKDARYLRNFIQMAEAK